MNREHFDILFAEDDPDITLLLSTLLKRSKYSVKQAYDGLEAINAVDDIPPPKLVLLDIMMPQRDGIEVIEHIRKKPSWSNVPIVVLSAKSQQADIQLAMSRGANDFLLKPFDPHSLVQHLEKFIH